MSEVLDARRVGNGTLGDEYEYDSRNVANNMDTVAPTVRVELDNKYDEHVVNEEVVGDSVEPDGVLNHCEAVHLDGGIDKSSIEETEFIPADDELKDRIVKQVEFYFSDANILKDAFLLKHVRRNKQGFVSLKLITSFRKVKSLTKDYRVVGDCLSTSDNLEVNDEGTKVRRKEPLPDYDETTPSRTVVAVNLPFENPSIENVAEMFSQSGDIALVRILRPGKPLPQDVKKHLMKHPELGNTVCAVIEFEQHQSAKAACEAMNDGDDWRKGLRVVLLAPTKKDKGPVPTEKKTELQSNMTMSRGARRGSGDSENIYKAGDPQVDFEAMQPCNKDAEAKNRRRRGARRKQHNSRIGELAEAGGDSSNYSSASDVDSSDKNDGRKEFAVSSLSPWRDPTSNHLTPGSTPGSSPRSSPRVSPRNSPSVRRRSQHTKSPLATLGGRLSPARLSPHGSPDVWRRKSAGSLEITSVDNGLGGSNPSSPWVQRRLRVQQESSPVPGSSPCSSPSLGRRFAEGTLRQPKGPDGGRGFGGGMGRGRLI